MLLEKWLDIDSKNKKEVQAMMPKRVKRRKDGEEEGWEEYYDYVFPDDQQESLAKGAKILEMAHKWKQEQ